MAVGGFHIPWLGNRAETGVVMLIYLNQALDERRARKAEGGALTRNDLYDAIMEGAVERVRPKMMTVMDAKPTGDVDADFAAMMIAHHVGAIEMAQAQLRAGRNEQLRRLAQEIIVTQQQEIEVMRVALADRSHSGPAAPTPRVNPTMAAAPTRPPAPIKPIRSTIATACMPRSSFRTPSP